jgi:hypothetical protein
LPTPIAASGDSSLGVPAGTPAPGTSFPTACRPDGVFTDTFAVPLGRLQNTATTIAAPQITDRLRYSQTTKRYTFIEFDSTVDSSISFGPENIDTGKTTAEQTLFQRSCANTPGPTVYSLQLFNPGAANPTLKLSYASFGLFTVESVSSAPATFTTNVPFGYAIATSAAGFARSGSATYTGFVQGKGSDGSSSFDVTGNLTTSVDFTAKTFSTRLDLTVKNAQTGTTVNVVTVNFNQSGTPSLASLTGTASTGSGDLAGVLGGPQAEEVALAATLTVQNPLNLPANIRLAVSGAGKR